MTHPNKIKTNKQKSKQKCVKKKKRLWCTHLKANKNESERKTSQRFNNSPLRRHTVGSQQNKANYCLSVQQIYRPMQSKFAQHK